MLAYILAITVAIGSFSFYMAAFFVPEMHRRQDFFWSGLGLFYAVVLWFCAGRLTGAVLLGQLVSVALLGGLGWHTLTLRRDLTPELVQTPVTWEDLQKLMQDLQRLLRQYGRLDDIANFGRATWEAITQIVTNWRDRTAAAPVVDTAAEVPPLKRSPAYEFETAPGDGQAVPTEFATVASRPSPKLEPSATVEAEDEAEPAIADTTAASTEVSNSPPAPTESEPTPAADADAEVTGASPPPPPATTAAAQESSAAGSRQTLRAAESPNAVPPPSVTKPSQSKSRQTNPVAGVAGWLGNMIGEGRKPKPQRGVIDIPPRPPSIPKDSDGATAASKSSTAAAGKSRSAKSKRAVIEIPPRPPSIPRSPAASQPPARQPKIAEETNWVDVGDTGSSMSSSPAVRPAPEADTDAKPGLAPVDEANWPATETNWPTSKTEIRKGRDIAAKADSATELDDDTNWPDDADTNWPD